MTDQQPPQDQPEVPPPAGQPGPPAYGPPSQPEPPRPSYPQAGPPPYAPPAQPPYQGPYPQPGQQWTAPPPPPKGGRGSIWLGIGITVAVLAASWGIITLPYNESLSPITNGLSIGLPLALVLAGIVMAAIPRTTRTGAGILIGIGGLVLVAGGLCVALLAGFSVGAVR